MAMVEFRLNLGFFSGFIVGRSGSPDSRVGESMPASSLCSKLLEAEGALKKQILKTEKTKKRLSLSITDTTVLR
jgi:hypothetical protein